MIRSGENNLSALDLSADKRRALELTPVSNEIVARLDRLVGLFLQWQTKMNLVARSTIPELWSRHIADSLQLIDRKSTRLNSSHIQKSRMPSSA